MPRHNVALDYLRTFVTIIVVAHHSILAYASFAHFDREHYLWSTAPIIDSQRWAGFDLFIVFNDIFFMALMFFLSGLFVWPALQRKGSGRFLRDRSLRLGLPFALVVTFLMPLAYYPSFRMTGADPGFAAFWWQSLRFGPWPGGPAWFIWVLLGFDIAAAALHKIAPGAGPALSRIAFAHPLAGFAGLTTISAIAYLPMLLWFGPTHWFAVGPFAVQASRLLLYAVYFFAGVSVGLSGLEQGLLAKDGRLVRSWFNWALAALALFALVVVLQVADMGSRVGWSLPTARIIYSLTFVLSCSTCVFAFLALFLRFVNKPVPHVDILRDNAYGVYLIHYVFVVWLQYFLLRASFPAVAKAAGIFLVASALSWSLVAFMRRVPAVAHFI